MSEENMNETEGAAPVDGRAAGEAQAVKTVRGKNYLLAANGDELASAVTSRTVTNGTLSHAVLVKSGAVHFKAQGSTYDAANITRFVSCSRPLIRGRVDDVDASFKLTPLLAKGQVRLTPGRRYVWKTEPGIPSALGFPLHAMDAGEALGLEYWVFTPKDGESAFYKEFVATCNVCRVRSGKVIAR